MVVNIVGRGRELASSVEMTGSICGKHNDSQFKVITQQLNCNITYLNIKAKLDKPTLETKWYYTEFKIEMQMQNNPSSSLSMMIDYYMISWVRWHPPLNSAFVFCFLSQLQSCKDLWLRLASYKILAQTYKHLAKYSSCLWISSHSRHTQGENTTTLCPVGVDDHFQVSQK